MLPGAQRDRGRDQQERLIVKRSMLRRANRPRGDLTGRRDADIGNVKRAIAEGHDVKHRTRLLPSMAGFLQNHRRTLYGSVGADFYEH